MGQQVEIHRFGRKLREPRAMSENMADGDLSLAMPGELGDVVRHPVVQAQHVLLVEFVDQHGGHGLRRRKEIDRGVQTHDVLRVNFARAIRPPRDQAQGAIQGHLPTQTHAALDRRMCPGLVERLHPLPQLLEASGRESKRLGIFFFTPTRQGFEIPGRGRKR